MHLLRDTSISRKLKLVIMWTTSATLLLACSAFVTYDLISVRQSMASDLSTLAKIIGTNSTAAVAFSDPDSAKDLLSGLSAKKNIACARLSLDKGEVFAEYVRDAGFSPWEPEQQFQGIRFYQGHLVASEPIVLDGEVIGRVCLVSDLKALDERIAQYAGVVTLILSASLLVAFLISSRLQRMISGPISHLARTARAVSVQKDYTIRATKHGRDELGTLIDGFNEMLGQIQERDARLQTARDELERRVEERTKELQDEIAERKRIEDVLRHSEEHFRSLIENASDVITIIDSKGTILYESPSVERMLGLTPQSLIGKSTLALTHPEDRKAALDLFAAAAREGGPAGPFELRFKHADGTWRTLEVIGRVVKNESGAEEAIINSRDITERKNAERELRISEGYRGIVWEGALNPMRLTDAEGNVVLVNDAYCKLMERPREALEGCLLSAAYLGEQRARILEKHRERFRSRSLPPNVESEVVLWNGKRLLLEVSFSFVSRFEDPPLLLSVFSDVTQRKQAEESLRESEAVFRSLAESVSAAIYIYRDSKHVYLNPAAETISGYTHDELMDMNVWDILHPDFREPMRERSKRRQDGENVPPRSEIKIQTKSGEVRWLDLTASLIQFQGEPAVLATAFDITERKGWEDALRESEEKYRTILQNIQEGYYEVDLTGTLTFFNNSLCRIVGSPPERLMGLNNREYTDAETARKLYTAFHQVFRSGEPLDEYQYQIVTRDGELKFLETSILLRRDQAGQICGFRGTLRDITERKRGEAALHESEQRYRMLFENNPQPMWAYDLETLSFLAVNEAAIHHYGYSRDEFLAMTIRDIRPPEDIPMLLDAVSRAGDDSELMATKWRHCKKDGTIIDVEITSHTLMFAGRRAELVLATDITERSRAEQALRESEDRYKTLFESATDGIMIFEADEEQAGSIVAANPAAAENTGYTVEELTRLTMADLHPPHQAEFAAQSRLRILRGERFTFELLRRRKDGTTFPIEVNAGPLTLGGKRYILSFARDLTQRKQIEQEATMLAHAVRSIQECVSITDNEATVLFVNDAFLRTYGYERQELIGRSLLDLVRPQSLGVIGAALPPRNLSTRWDGELINCKKDGTEFPIHLSASPILDEKGQATALVGVAQDITDRKRAIEELQKAKEAAECASSAKSEFLANMSHEIRTPMNGIIGMTELALDTDLTAEQREYLRLVKLSADSLLGVINDILDFSKIEAGKLALDLDEFNLQDAIDEVMKALGVRADQKGLELAYYLRPGVPELVVGDLGRLRQILVNLVGNAIKFTERGEVIVRVEAETQTDDEVFLHFGVRDTGIGVPSDKQAIIFDSFTQADGSTTRKYGGTGLGLAISSQLVHLMNGQIWVESPVDLPDNKAISGSMFHFTARLGLPRTPPRDMQNLDDSLLEGLPVLVVDDNATNRRILEVQLTNWGMRPVTADGATSALTAIKEAEDAGSPFKLALLDFHMPEMDGLALTEQIRMLQPGGDLRTVMMSSSVHQNRAHQRRLGISASLVKPVKAADLLSVIKTVLSTEASLETRPRQTALKTQNPLRVLVAEDSSVNQELIRRLLEKWGHAPVIAENGKAALALLEFGRFDLVLMDLQMPEINGFEATAAIREKERSTGAHIPIIALTAHALKGDRELCLGAGMDDYISKPVEAQKLFDVVESAAINFDLATGDSGPRLAALDIDVLMKNFDGDRELLLMLARIFADSYPTQLSILSEAVAVGDAAAIVRGAHALKGSVANFRAEAAIDAAAKLEHTALTGDLSNADNALAVLEKEIERLREELGAFEQMSSL